MSNAWDKWLLTLWGRVTHICVSKLTIIGSDNGLSPGRRQAIIWTNIGILLTEPLGTNLSETLIQIHIFSLNKMHLQMLSAHWRPFCPGLDALTQKWPPSRSPTQDCSIWWINLPWDSHAETTCPEHFGVTQGVHNVEMSPCGTPPPYVSRGAIQKHLWALKSKSY